MRGFVIWHNTVMRAGAAMEWRVATSSIAKQDWHAFLYTLDLAEP